MKRAVVCIVAVALVSSVACKPSMTVDFIAPSVILTVPADGDMFVDAETPITIVFSEPIAPQTVSDASLKLNGTPFDGTYELHRDTLYFKPSGGLLWNASYVARLAADIADTAGNRISTEISWSFKTRDSLTGRVWTRRESGTTHNLNAVAWSGERFVAVGDGVILASVDGIVWDDVTPEIPVGLHEITWTGDQFVAIAGGIILRSSDGVTWSKPDLGLHLDTDSIITGVLYKNLRHAAMASSPRECVIVERNGDAFVSDDFILWKRHNGASPLGKIVEDVVWTGSKFVAVGRMPDPTPPDYYRGGGRLYAPTVGISADGAVWHWNEANVRTAERLRMNAIAYRFPNVAWTGIMLVSVGSTEKNGHSSIEPLTLSSQVEQRNIREPFWTSADGKNWIEDWRISHDWISIANVYYKGGLAIAVGSPGMILVSDDGTAWEEVKSPPIEYPRGIAASDKVIVVVGYDGAIITSP